MTDYPPTAFGADTITESNTIKPPFTNDLQLSDRAALSLLEDIPTSKSLKDLGVLEDLSAAAWLLDDIEADDTLESENLSYSLVAPETSQPNDLKPTYRGRFMRGKEDEYAATEEVFLALYGENKDVYGDKYHHTTNPHLTAIQQCRKYANFKREKMTGEVKVWSSACRERWCPMCSGQKVSYAKEQTQIYIESLSAARFLTLTLRNNTNNLKDQIEFLMMSFRTLRQRAYWKKHVTGGIWFLQIKRGKNSGCWHPHLHILLDGESMMQSRLSQLWEQVTFGSPVIDIRKVNDVERVAKYVARYCARPAMLKDMPLLDRIEVIESLFRKRLCGTFGTGKTVTLTPPKVEANGEWQDVGYYDEVVRDAKKNTKAQAILRAYFNNTVLEEEVFESYTGLKVSVDYEPYEPPKKPQMYLDFYNR